MKILSTTSFSAQPLEPLLKYLWHFLDLEVLYVVVNIIVNEQKDNHQALTI